MAPGQIIVFDLETWQGEQMVMKEFKSEILRICEDPLQRHESKCIVMVNDIQNGIPFSLVKKVIPAYGEQLEMF